MSGTRDKTLALLLASPLVVLLAVTGCVAGKVATEQGQSSTAAVTSSANSPVAAAGGNTPAGSTATGVTPVGAACGYKNTGQLVHVADGVDVCLPPTSCNAETCPPPLGSCVAGACVMKAGYKGIQTLPEAWVTYYCQLSSNGCNGVTQVAKVNDTAAKLASQLSLSLCEGAAAGADCVGIAASSPMMVGNSQLAVDAATGAQVRPWGLGLSEASNVCYQLKGPGGTAYVALTDRCGGYCKCGGSGYQECGPCVNASDMTPNCPCVGTAPGVADACCGADCSPVVPACDWCASNNHPHFDLDQGTFNHICGALSVQGSCKLTGVMPIACPLGVTWPPP